MPSDSLLELTCLHVKNMHQLCQIHATSSLIKLKNLADNIKDRLVISCINKQQSAWSVITGMMCHLSSILDCVYYELHGCWCRHTVLIILILDLAGQTRRCCGTGRNTQGMLTQLITNVKSTTSLCIAIIACFRFPKTHWLHPFILHQPKSHLTLLLYCLVKLPILWES